MNIFTNDDYRRIQAWLKANAIKDSDFAVSEDIVPNEDILVITQNMSTVPTNYRIRIKDLLNSSLAKIVIDSITAKSVKVNNVLIVDAANIKLDNVKGTTLQDVLNYFEENKLNRHTDDVFDGNLTIKKDLTIEGHIKSDDGLTTVEENFEATGEITDGQGNMLSDVNSAAKGWKIEYQDPQQDEPTVRAKYILKDYKGVPKGNVIKVYKDSAITNVYLGTTDDTCNPDTGEVTKHKIHDNNEALSIVYRLDTGKYMLVNVPLGIFTREAEFDKYRGLGIEPNGQVFVKLASDVESTNYLHFNSLGEIAADGIEARILRDLGTLISSVAGDGTMWGQYKKDEGTQENSTPNDGSRWGEYKEAEAHRNALSNSNNIVYHEEWNDSEGPEWEDPIATESNIAYNWKTADTPASDGKREGNLKDLYQKNLDTDEKITELENKTILKEISLKGSGWKNTIKVTVGDRFVLKVISGALEGYCISDERGQAVNTAVTVFLPEGAEREVVIDTDGYFSVYTNLSETVVGFTDSKSLQYSIDRINKAIGILQRDVELTFLDGYRRFDNKTIYGGSSYFHSAPVHVSKGDYILYRTGESAETIVTVGQVDENSNFVSVISNIGGKDISYSFVANRDMFIEVCGFSSAKERTRLYVISNNIFSLIDGNNAPELYGAVGDGVADDTDAILTAVSQKRDVILKGTYLISKSVVLNKGQRIIGGKITTNKIIDMIVCPEGNVVDGVEIDGGYNPDVEATGALTGIKAGVDCVIKNCEIYSCYGNMTMEASGIRIDHGDRTVVDNCYIHDIDAVQAGEAMSVVGSCQGILSHFSKDVRINNCVVENIKGREGDGILIYYLDSKGNFYNGDTVVSDCVVRNCKYRSYKLQAINTRLINCIATTDTSVIPNRLASFIAPDCIMKGCYFKAKVQPKAFAVVEIAKSAVNSILNNCIIEGSYNVSDEGRCVQNDANKVTITENVFKGGYYSLYNKNQMTYVVIRGNQFINFIYCGTTISEDLSVAGSKCIEVSNNTFITKSTGHTNNRSITIWSNSRATHIHSNVFIATLVNNWNRPVRDIVFEESNNAARIEYNSIPERTIGGGVKISGDTTGVYIFQPDI